MPRVCASKENYNETSSIDISALGGLIFDLTPHADCMEQSNLNVLLRSV
jgi:hypothetical protein